MLPTWFVMAVTFQDGEISLLANVVLLPTDSWICTEWDRGDFDYAAWFHEENKKIGTEQPVNTL